MHAEPIMTLLPGFEARELKHAPDELWLAGDKTLLTEHRRAAVVGSRKASPEGLMHFVQPLSTSCMSLVAFL